MFYLRVPSFTCRLPAALKDAAPWGAMEEHVLVDLDLGCIEPPVGAPASDSGRLPAWEQLTETFSIMMVRAPAGCPQCLFR